MVTNRCFGEEYKKIMTTVNGTNNNKEILNLFKEKFEGNDRDMQQENNGIISRIDAVNNIFIERRTVHISICKLKERIYCSKIRFNHINKTATVFRKLLYKIFKSLFAA